MLLYYRINSNSVRTIVTSIKIILLLTFFDILFAKTYYEIV